MHILALGFEELGVVCWGGDDRAIDGDVGRYRISSGRVDVECFEFGTAVYSLIIVVDKDLSG
jgi:hypothetical protein